MKSAQDVGQGLGDGDFDQRLDAVLSSATDLPTMPTILWELQAAIQDAKNGAAEISMVIEQDPSLAANVLRLANSSYSGSRMSFSSIRNAVAHVGLKEIERLASTTVIIESFASSADSVDYENFWIHGIQAAEAASFIADRNPVTSPVLPAEAYMAGLVHDVGKLILREYFPRDFERVREHQEIKICTDAEAEQAILGFDHGEIAARLMEYWNLTPSILEGARWHHRVEQCDEEFRPFAETIRRADALCHACKDGEVPSELLPHPFLGLDSEAATSFVQTFHDARERAILLFA